MRMKRRNYIRSGHLVSGSKVFGSKSVRFHYRLLIDSWITMTSTVQYSLKINAASVSCVISQLRIALWDHKRTPMLMFFIKRQLGCRLGLEILFQIVNKQSAIQKGFHAGHRFSSKTSLYHGIAWKLYSKKAIMLWLTLEYHDQLFIQTHSIFNSIQLFIQQG